MQFVQMIEFRSSQIDEMRKVASEMEGRGDIETSPSRIVLAQDRDNPGRYLNIVFFDSYEKAMENSSRPDINEFAQRMMALADGPPTFHNLDVLDDRAP